MGCCTYRPAFVDCCTIFAIVKRINLELMIGDVRLSQLLFLARFGSVIEAVVS